MTSLAFPTGRLPAGGPSPITVGHPERATACRCDKPLIDLDTDACFRCGHYPSIVINKTWHDRAQILANKRRKQRELPRATPDRLAA